jgi:hypothetical protein
MTTIAHVSDGELGASVLAKINSMIDRLNDPFVQIMDIDLTGASVDMRLPLDDRSWNDLRFKFSGAKIDNPAASLSIQIEAQDGALGDAVDGTGNTSNALILVSGMTPATLLDGQMDLGGYTNDFGTIDNIANVSALDVQIAQTTQGRIGWRCVGGIYALHLLLPPGGSAQSPGPTPVVTQGRLQVFGRR